MAIQTINSVWLHDINQATGTSKRRQFSDNNDVADFVNKFVDKILETKRRRAYRFPRDTVEARTLILKVHGNSNDERSADAIADLLAAAEKVASKKYGHLQPIQDGNLLQVYFKDGTDEHCFMAKVDLLRVLDSTSLKYRDGLPVERYMMKACLISLTPSPACQSIWVCDSNSSIAGYWSEDFLGLEAVRNDTDNTKDSFDAIESLLVKSVKIYSLSDYRRMRSGVLGYMKNQDHVVYEDMIKTVFAAYEPDIASIDMVDLRKRLEALPEKKGFDTQFTVDKKAISRKREHSLALTDHLELTIKDDDAIAGTIKAVKEGTKKALRIYTDEGYDYFHAREGTNTR
jgi:hypothetical protein